MIAYFERFEIKMTLKQAKSVSHQGECLPDVLELLKNEEYVRQFKKIDSESIRGIIDKRIEICSISLFVSYQT